MNTQKGSAAVIILIVLGVIASFFVLAVIGSALNLITIPWLKFDRQVQMERDIVSKTYNADNALYNYRWFKDRAEAIKALDKTIEQSWQAVSDFEFNAGLRADWTFEDKTEASRLRAVAQGQKAQYNSLVGEYNSRAQQVDRAIFIDDLPLFFSIKPY